jgi:hypothetical protein
MSEKDRIYGKGISRKKEGEENTRCKEVGVVVVVVNPGAYSSSCGKNIM